MYKVVFFNEDDVKETIEAHEFEYGENGIMRIVTDYEEDDENVKYIPVHRFISAEGIEEWISAEEKDEEEKEEEEEEENLIEE